MQHTNEIQPYDEELSRKPKSIKIHNHRLVLNLLRSTQAMSAADIAENIHLSKTSVMKILDNLQSLGMVVSVGEGSSTREGGRKPQLFQANAAFRNAVSLYISENTAYVGIVDFLGNISAMSSIPFSEPENAERSMYEAAAEIRRLLAEKSLSENVICGVSVAVDGIVNIEKGIVYYPIHNLAWGKNIRLLDILKQHLPEFKNIKIENSGRCFAYALMSSYPELRNRRVFSMQTGNYTGGCFFERGKIVRGSNSFLGEIGHISILPDNSDFQCECGGQGCFEAVVSPKAFPYWAAKLEEEHGRTEFSERLTGGAVRPEDMLRAANSGEPFARLVVDKLTTFFAKLIRNITLLCDPEVIVISGLYVNGGEYFLERLTNELREVSLFAIQSDVQIIYTTLDPDRYLSGGGIYMLDQYVESIQ